MSIHLSKISFALCLLILCVACDSKPKVIQSQSAKAAISANSIPALNEITGTKKTSSKTTSGEHKVLVEEVLNTEKYTYLNVLEAGKKQWIAIPRTDIKFFKDKF